MKFLQDFFEEILTFYPHGIQGRTKEGGMICYEQLGQGNAGELHKRGVTPDHLLRHFMLRNEFIFRKCQKSFRDGDLTANPVPSGDENAEKCTRLMTVLDVKGIKFSDFSGDVLR